MYLVAKVCDNKDVSYVQSSCCFNIYEDWLEGMLKGPILF